MDSIWYFEFEYPPDELTLSPNQSYPKPQAGVGSCSDTRAVKKEIYLLVVVEKVEGRPV